MEEAWGAITSAPGFVTQLRADYAGFMEELGQPPPVAFRNRKQLEAWISGLTHNPKIEPHGKGGRALFVHGKLRKSGGYFSQLWAQARYTKYRALLASVASRSYHENNLSGIDADHVLARTIAKGAPDAWLAIFPVYKSSNRGMGPLERQMPKFEPAAEYALLTPAAAFKIFNGRMVSNIDELKWAMKDVRGQILTEGPFLQNYLNDIEATILAYLKQR